MSDVVIKVEGLGKLYRYGQSGFSRHSLREALTDAARSTVHGARSIATWPFRRFRPSDPLSPSPRPSRSPRFKPLPVALPNPESSSPSPRPPRSPETHWVSPRFKPLPVALPNPQSQGPSPRPPRSPRFKPLPVALPNPESQGPSPRPPRSPRFKPLPVALPNPQSEIDTFWALKDVSSK